MRTTRDNLTMLRRYVFVSLVWIGLVVGASQVQAYPIVTYFDVVEGESVSGPPYPTSPSSVVKVYDSSSPILSTLPMEEVTFCYSVTPPELGTTMSVSDTGGGLDSAGTAATFAAYLKLDSPAPRRRPQSTSFLKLIPLAACRALSPVRLPT